jgi:hypothetical protein
MVERIRFELSARRAIVSDDQPSECAEDPPLSDHSVKELRLPESGDLICTNIL